MRVMCGLWLQCTLLYKQPLSLGEVTGDYRVRMSGCVNITQELTNWLCMFQFVGIRCMC